MRVKEQVWYDKGLTVMSVVSYSANIGSRKFWQVSESTKFCLLALMCPALPMFFLQRSAKVFTTEVLCYAVHNGILMGT